jgi:hypothetical protein
VVFGSVKEVISKSVFSEPAPDTVFDMEMGEIQKAPPKLTIPPETVLITMLSRLINTISPLQFSLFYEQEGELV